MNHHTKTITKLDNITEYPLNWPSSETSSTHELVIDKNAIYVTGQNMDSVAKLDYHGKILAHYEMPKNSGPHGILIDNEGRLWVSLEFHGQVVQLNKKGEIVQTVDVRMALKDSETFINTAPHGICLSADGQSIWFTGKRTSTVGKFNIDDKTEVKVEHFELENLASLPIFLSAGANGTIWGTELLSSAILNVSNTGAVQEFNIPTSNSRPIAIIPESRCKCASHVVYGRNRR